MGFRLLAVAGLFSVSAVLAWSQSSTATVSGTVTDQAGAFVPAASVQLTNTSTSVTLRTTTNEVGFFLVPGVIPGHYRLLIEAPGMQKFEATLVVQVQQSVVVDVTLRLGQVTTTVEVHDATPLLTVDRPTLGHVLERTRIEQLPINGRALTNLLVTVPGTEGLRAYGMRLGSHETVLDGAPLGDRNDGGLTMRQPGLDTVQEFTVETNSSSARFSRPTSVVIMTRSGTNQFHGSLFETHRNNAIGKARRREDYYVKPPQLVRNEFGASAGGPFLLPGFYDGRNRTFWFFAYEGTRNVNPATMGARVPTEAMRRGDFRDLKDAQGRQYLIYDPWTTNPVTWERQQFAYRGQLNVVDPALISPLAKYLFDITPLPTHPDVNPLVANNWWGPAENTIRDWTATFRADHNFSERDRFFARYTQGNFDRRQQRTDYNLPVLDKVAGRVHTRAPNKNLAVNWIRTISPTFFLEFVVSGSRQADWAGSGEPGRRYADELGLPNPFGVDGFPKIDATAALPGYRFWSHNTRGVPYFYGIVNPSATKIRGRHELQFGFHFRYDQLNILPDQQQAQGRHDFNTGATSLYDPRSARTNPLPVAYTGHGMANLFLGIANYSNRFQRSYYYVREKEYAAYLQDNVKVSPRLTLNLGLRWELWPGLREKNRILSSFDMDRRAIVLSRSVEELYRIGATLPAIVNRYVEQGARFVTAAEVGLPPGSLFETSKKDFGPRLGLAYRALEGPSSFVLRGGYRISYFHIPARTWVPRMALNSAPFVANFQTSLVGAAYTPDGIPNYGMRSIPTVIAGKNSRDAVDITDARALARGSAGGLFFAKQMPEPRAQDWNLTAEKEIWPAAVFRISYVGNHTARLEQRYTYNEPTPEYIWYVTTGLPLPTGEYANVARRPYDQTVYGMLEQYQRTGWSNYHGLELELERRYARGVGFQVFYNLGNALAAANTSTEASDDVPAIPELNQFLPGAVPADLHERNRFLNYRRDISIPKHRIRWNWIVDLPFGRGRWLGKNVGRGWDRLIGGWQIAGLGTLRSNYFALPTGIYPTGERIELYGYQYPIQDCTSGVCYPGYLWWNGYIPANRINSTDAQGRPNGIMGIPENYRPAGQPLIPWPKHPDPRDPLFPFYGTNTVWVTLRNGVVQRTTYNDNLHPWRNQYLPGVRQWGLTAAVFKTIPLNEQLRLRFNADFFNVLNMPGNPNAIGADGVLRTQTSGQAARELQLTLRLSW
jgi:hypothetical protein